MEKPELLAEDQAPEKVESVVPKPGTLNKNDVMLISQANFEVKEEQQKDTFVQLNNEKFLFKYMYSIEQRKKWSQEAADKYANKYPLIVEKDHKCENIDDL